MSANTDNTGRRRRVFLDSEDEEEDMASTPFESRPFSPSLSDEGRRRQDESDVSYRSIR